jgi:hypothetical protein
MGKEILPTIFWGNSIFNSKQSQNFQFHEYALTSAAAPVKIREEVGAIIILRTLSIRSLLVVIVDFLIYV